MVELTTHLLIPSNILWLPLCRIYKFGSNTLPSKTIVIPYTCVLSRARGAVWLVEGGECGGADLMASRQMARRGWLGVDSEEEGVAMDGR